MEYVGSRSAEIDAMIAAIDAGSAEPDPDWTAPVAGTDGAVPVDTQGVAAAELGEALTSLRNYVDAMEHDRQSRLQRWQKVDR